MFWEESMSSGKTISYYFIYLFIYLFVYLFFMNEWMNEWMKDFFTCRMTSTFPTHSKLYSTPPSVSSLIISWTVLDGSSSGLMQCVAPHSRAQSNLLGLISTAMIFLQRSSTHAMKSHQQTISIMKSIIMATIIEIEIKIKIIKWIMMNTNTEK